MKFILLLHLFTYLLLSESFSYVSYNARDLYTDALNSYSSGEYSKTIKTLEICQEYMQCSSMLAKMYAKGDKVDVEIEKAVYYYKKAISKGDKRSLHNLALLYHRNSKFEDAKRYYKLSVDEGFKKSLYNLARVYEIEKNIKKALYYYKEASKESVAQGDYALALYYYKMKNFKLTKFYFEKAAKLDFEPATVALKKLNIYLKSQSKAVKH